MSFFDYFSITLCKYPAVGLCPVGRIKLKLPTCNEVASGYPNCSGSGMVCQVGLLGQWDASTQGMCMRKLVVSVEKYGGKVAIFLLNAVYKYFLR